MPTNSKFSKNFFIFFFVLIIFLFSTPLLGYLALTSYLKATVYHDLNIVLYSEAEEAMDNSWFPSIGKWYLGVVSDYYDRFLNKDFLLPDYDPLSEIRLYDVTEEQVLFEVRSVDAQSGTAELALMTPLQFMGDVVNSRIECAVNSTTAGEIYTSTKVDLAQGGALVSDNTAEGVAEEDFERIFALDFSDEPAVEVAPSEGELILEIASGLDRTFEITGSVVEFLANLMERPDVQNGFAKVQLRSVCPDYECERTGTECVINVVAEEL